MSRRIRIGNQTAFSAAEPMAPFEFALEHGFDAFEWFADKKQNEDGSWSGWDTADMDATRRAEVKRIGEDQDILYTVHAPWQANPLRPEGEGLLRGSLDFARDIGASLVNLHLYMEEGAQVFLDRLAPVISHAAQTGPRIAIENTPLTTPANFREFFACLQRSELPGQHVGMCLDMGHANLCERTRNDYVRYVDELGTEVPIIHVHLHENYGDADSHLPLFSGPARDNDGGVRALVKRLNDRRYEGALILEVWPQPPERLSEVEKRLRSMLGGSGRKHRPHDERHEREEHKGTRHETATPATGPRKPTRPRRPGTEIQTAASPSALPDYPEHHDALTGAVVETHQKYKSWRQRLGWVQQTLTGPDFESHAENLATLAVYLRFLGTGEAACEEDGRHFRPNHHARAAADIEDVLGDITTLSARPG